MLWGVFSDVHSNYDALEAVLAEMEKRGARQYLCLGDFVGYGPQPNECIERIRALPVILPVRGNHDLAVLGRMDLEWFNDNAKAAVIFSQDTLSEDNFKWLKELPPRVDREEFTLVHGSPRNTAEEYLVTIQQFHDNLKYFKISPLLVGHSHIPVCFLMKEPISYVEAGQLEHEQQLVCPRGVRVVINPGSVGQPRDQDSRASCGVYDDQTRTFTLYRVEYDLAMAQKRIRDAGLPEFLAARLAYGQ